MTVINSVSAKWILLLVVVLGAFIYDMTRTRREGRHLSEKIAYACVLLGLAGLLASEFNLLGNFSGTAPSVSFILIVGGAVLDLLVAFYEKLNTPAGKGTS